MSHKSKGPVVISEVLSDGSRVATLQRTTVAAEELTLHPPVVITIVKPIETERPVHYIIFVWALYLGKKQERADGWQGLLTLFGLQLWLACWRRRLSWGSADLGAWWTPSQPSRWVHTDGWWSGQYCQRVLHQYSVHLPPAQKDDENNFRDQTGKSFKILHRKHLYIQQKYIQWVKSEAGCVL